MTQRFDTQRTAIDHARRVARARARELCDECTHARWQHAPASDGGGCYLPACACIHFEEAAS